EIVAERAHRRLAPLVLGGAEAQGAGDELVPVREARRLDLDRVAHDALQREAAVVDGGSDVFDDGGLTLSPTLPQGGGRTLLPLPWERAGERVPIRHHAPSGMNITAASGGRVR